MIRDMAKKYEADKKSQAKIYDRFSVKVRKDSHLMEFMNSAAQKAGVSKNLYVVQAVREKLEKDGYRLSTEEDE